MTFLADEDAPRGEGSVQLQIRDGAIEDGSKAAIATYQFGEVDQAGDDDRNEDGVPLDEISDLSYSANAEDGTDPYLQLEVDVDGEYSTLQYQPDNDGDWEDYDPTADGAPAAWHLDIGSDGNDEVTDGSWQEVLDVVDDEADILYSVNFSLGSLIGTNDERTAYIDDFTFGVEGGQTTIFDFEPAS